MRHRRAVGRWRHLRTLMPASAPPPLLLLPLPLPLRVGVSLPPLTQPLRPGWGLLRARRERRLRPRHQVAVKKGLAGVEGLCPPA
jgi:hypothetical protein